MKYTQKILILSAILIGAFLFIPSICNAAGANASNEQTLKDAIANANNGEIDTITLTDSITVTGPLTDITRSVTVEGSGFTISGSDDWYNVGGSGNQSIITSTDGVLTLKNMILKHGPKQGAQAYGNGKLVLDGVTISDCKYSGLIANGGTIEIRDLNLNTTVGVEVGKSATNPVDNNPELIMNGTLKSISQVLLYEDPKTQAQLTIENDEDSANKLFVTENATLITDKNNNILYETANYSDIAIENSDMAEENFATVTIHYDGKTKKFVATKNETLSKYDLSDVKNINGKVFVHFVKGDNEVFSEDKPITDDLELTAVYKGVEDKSKDKTPKTGVSDYLGLAFITLFVSASLMVTLKRKFL